MRPLASSRAPYGFLTSILVVFLFHIASGLASTTTPAAPSTTSNGRLADTTSSDAQALVDKALSVLAVVNKDRVENPVFNENSREDPDEEYKPAPLLDYDADPESIAAAASTSSRVRRSENATTLGSYRIPKELAEAAAAVAESTPQIPEGDHEKVAARMRTKYTPDFLNDTNAAAELQAPEGRLSVFAGDAANEKRASGYWLIDDQQFPGQSPFSPSGYQVWRNVKDFGAKGDGTTDDTAAINKAISDGARCGEECKTSTIAPAVVYFPPGTYLVSGSIIQYYNTQFLGDPINVPTILAASSFVGLGVFTSNKYIADNVGWYLNTANFLRSIKNFKIDIRLTDPYAYVCAIHWQVAQAASLENIEFYMLYNSDVPHSTQQGIYMENGSGGFLADLTFVGGNFGAYFGNQQFTTSHLIFVNSKIALQVHWDWAWTMQDFVIEGCENGLIITGGAGGAHSTGQGVGSLILMDTIIANTPNGIVTSLHAENSTSFLLQNVGFFNVQTAVSDSFAQKTLLAGGNEVYVDSWGFGRIANKDGASTFVNGAAIPVMNRTEELTGVQNDKMKPNLFTRRRPKYYDVSSGKVMNVRALGAKGDGKTDDTAVLNSILSGAANTSSIVYFPFGVYIVKDTLRVPMGSRIIGQVWSQIMGTGANFEDESKPRPVVQVGRPSDPPGIIEIQDMMFTVSGPTAGAVLMEWNAQESSKGSVGMWDSHFRVGGAIGSNLQQETCAKKSGSVNPDCKAASMLLHLKPESTAYLENVWAWVADHDLDKSDRPQIDIYVGRGILIQSKKAWLWGTASEHCALYQYQVSDATNIVMGMIQTESPYYQPVPVAPKPFRTGIFPDDPTFSDCKADDVRCYSSWALRVVDSTAVYILGAGLYSWFSDYSQTCLDTNDCQRRGVEIQQSADLWIYNLCTKAILEMVTPTGGIATAAADNMNGFLSSILAWLEGSEETSGRRVFPGFPVYTLDGLRNQVLPDPCKTALSAKVLCDYWVQSFAEPAYHGSLGNASLTDSVCDEGCGESLRSWFTNVNTNCEGYTVAGDIPTLYGGRMWAGYNGTCLTDPETGKYCNDIIAEFTTVSSIDDMPQAEMCSDCYVNRLAMMQASSYTVYNNNYKSDLELVYKTCGHTGNTTVPPPITSTPEQSTMCVSDEWYTVGSTAETCEDVGFLNNVSTVALYTTNPDIFDCSSIPSGTELCLPLSCGKLISYTDNDTCAGLEARHDLTSGDIRRFNPWVYFDCSNLGGASSFFGNILCAAPQNGLYTAKGPGSSGDNTTPGGASGYTFTPVEAPANSTVADGTTTKCGKWHVVQEGDSCVSICLSSEIDIALLLEVNPSLGTEYIQCTPNLELGNAYCTGPNYDWDVTDEL
ncbi:Pectin lyase fold virulence factor [Fusarium keratoplasticum]|uniref:Pectin lyase fold virulence factor n=1 Tax=Fusarium keratoplasticum TaxID=1328300 RepID=A0ACC0QDR6_9HYPO|nr:Pectin lyase fold virulence factor [Fusarium keratoplasticum]KAI8648701.1 Pectin lyase fold virulence factor [Fusarium keratoplasticum]